jgi:D-alanyl-lipoteichoic acid acyltransferase DltB (MBOAT superfamily)
MDMNFVLWYFVIGFCTGTALFAYLWRDSRNTCECVTGFLAGLIVWWFILFCIVCIGILEGGEILCKKIDRKRGL